MNRKFHVGKGRYGALAGSRYMSFTYGRESFSKAEEDAPKKQSHGTYGALLFDKRWIARRLDILTRDSNACVNCQETVNLQVHHRQYHFIKALQQFKAPWDYEDYLMITLCDRCHSKGHGKYKIPNIYF
jgi:hypothetical protein